MFLCYLFHPHSSAIGCYNMYIFLQAVFIEFTVYVKIYQVPFEISLNIPLTAVMYTQHSFDMYFNVAYNTCYNLYIAIYYLCINRNILFVLYIHIFKLLKVHYTYRCHIVY